MFLILLATCIVFVKRLAHFKTELTAVKFGIKGLEISLYRMFENCFDNLDHSGECSVRTD